MQTLQPRENMLQVQQPHTMRNKQKRRNLTDDIWNDRLADFAGN